MKNLHHKMNFAEHAHQHIGAALLLVFGWIFAASAVPIFISCLTSCLAFIYYYLMIEKALKERKERNKKN